MVDFVKRGMSAVLAVLLALSTGVPSFAEDDIISLAPEEEIFEETELLYSSDENSLEDIIRPQIEAYAKSIDKVNANKDAQDALVGHGMRGRGKDLSVGENHALTATLMNSELGKEGLSSICTQLIETAKENNLKKIYGLTPLYWVMGSSNTYYGNIYDSNKSYGKNASGEFTFAEGSIKKLEKGYVNAVNAYDKSLEMIAGGVCSDIDLITSKIYDNKIVYDVNVTFMDVFNFDTENGSALEDLLGFIGLLLFTPFEWESKFSFQIEIPNTCEHSYEIAVTNPTCAEKGAKTHICTICGYSYSEEIAAIGHSFGEWSVYAKPTVGKAGEERKNCANCDYYESKEIPAYLFGDTNCDGKVNTIDANYVRRCSAGLFELDERQYLAADVDGNGEINVFDASLIRRYTVKLINLFPVEEIIT